METTEREKDSVAEESHIITNRYRSADDTYPNTREEYFVALQKWINDAQMWQTSMTCMPYFFMSHPELFPGVVPPLSTNSQGDPIRRTPFGVHQGTPNRNQANNAGGLRYKVPPYWKRFCAEVVDSVITLILKLIITFVAIHVFEFIDLDKYSMEMFQQNVQSLTYVAVEMTSQLLALELISRIVVCLLEAYWLRSGEGGRFGGSTPGKNLLGLRVVLCYQAHPVPGQPNDVVVVTPGTDLGWGWALTRALSKNIFLALIYPLCFAFFFFKFNRLGYDVLSHSIVVENVDHNNNRR